MFLWMPKLGGFIVRFHYKDIITIPNLLSMFRIILIPFFVTIYLLANVPKDYYIATFIILLSSLSDFFDGLIARRFNQISEFGKALDPIADKLTQIAIAACLLFRFKYMWLLFGLLIIKELFMAINGLILLKRGRKLDGAMWFGKVSTAVFYVTTLVLIAFPTIDSHIANLLILVAGFFLLLSFILYIPEYIKLYRN